MKQKGGDPRESFQQSSEWAGLVGWFDQFFPEVNEWAHQNQIVKLRLWNCLNFQFGLFSKRLKRSSYFEWWAWGKPLRSSVCTLLISIQLPPLSHSFPTFDHHKTCTYILCWFQAFKIPNFLQQPTHHDRWILFLPILQHTEIMFWNFLEYTTFCASRLKQECCNPGHGHIVTFSTILFWTVQVSPFTRGSTVFYYCRRAATTIHSSQPPLWVSEGGALLDIRVQLPFSSLAHGWGCLRHGDLEMWDVCDVLVNPHENHQTFLGASELSVLKADSPGSAPLKKVLAAPNRSLSLQG